MLFVLICYSTLLMFLSFAQAEQRPLDHVKVLKSAYKDSLDIYSENGEKLGRFERPEAAVCLESGVTMLADRTAPVASGIG